MTETYRTLVEAAKAIGAERGIEGGPGGWLRDKSGGGNKPLLIQGWAEFGLDLVRQGFIDPQDAQGVSVRRVRGSGWLGRNTLTIRPDRAWRRDAVQFAIIRREA
jgi:hypothetical protein